MTLKSQTPDLTITRKATSLAINTWTHPNIYLRSNHNSISRKKSKASETFEVRKKKRWVTTVSVRNGIFWYMRSEKVGFYWSTILISSSKAENRLLDIVASSVEVGPPSSYSTRNNASVDRIMKLSLEYYNNRRQNEAGGDAIVNEKPLADQEITSSSGTGFYINSEGKIVTNHHVIDECSEIRINGNLATVEFKSKEFDIAVIHTNQVNIQPDFIKISPKAARLNSDVTVAGFPYNGILDSLNITRGAVSSLKGIAGDAKYIQISAPVQPGNSGGPAVNEFGNLVGVVAARISASKVIELTGSLPENINFAVKAEILKLLLDSNEIDYHLGSNQDLVSTHLV
jgi:serine protease Do